jgi:arylsulfatase A-like enzyme
MENGLLVKILLLAGIVIVGGIFVLVLEKANISSVPDFKCSDCNVIFVSFDALQASHVHNLGYFRDVTPTIDKMASQGFNFVQAISVSSWTVPSSMTWFTGVYPSQHKVVNKYSTYSKDEKVISNLKKLSPNMVTLAEVLKKNGYATGGFTGDSGVSGVFGFNAGFDVYFDNTPPFSGMELSSPKALNWITENKDKKFFLFLHGYDSHGQYVPPDGFDYRFADPGYNWKYNGSREQQAALRELGLQQGYLNLSSDDVKFWRAVYDEKIQRADAKFAKFLEEFEKLGLMNKTIFVLTSDHGTEVYEHGKFDHGFSLYDELVHVPLVIVLPGSNEGKIVGSQVRNLDIMPTILDLLNINVDRSVKNQMEGVSLVPLMRGDNLNLDAFVETDYRQYTYKRAIRTNDGWKFIYSMENGRKELYNIKDDPQELNNLADKEPEISAELQQRLFDHIKQMGQDPTKKWEVGCNPVYPTQCQ